MKDCAIPDCLALDLRAISITTRRHSDLEQLPVLGRRSVLKEQGLHHSKKQLQEYFHHSAESTHASVRADV